MNQNPLFGLDAPQPSQAAPPSVQTSGNPLLSLDKPATGNGAQSSSYDIPKSFGSGIVEGAEGLVGLPGDIGSLMDRGAAWGAHKLGIAPPNMDDIPAMARPGAGLPTSTQVHETARLFGVPDYDPQSVQGQYAKTVGSFVPGAAAFPVEGPGGALANIGRYAVAPGLASEAGGQAFKGTPAEPFIRTAAGILGGGVAAVGESAARSGIQAGRDLVEPLTASGQRAIAARKVQSSFTDPQAASRELEANSALQVPGAGLGEIVPGSKPTTGQLTGDLGALSLERELATRQPDLYRQNEFGTGAQQQNAARTAALEGIQSSGSPADVGNVIRQQLAAIDAQHSNTVQQLMADAQGQAASIGAGTPPEALGANLRSGLQNARDAARANERGLWNAVDPDGTLSLPANPVISGANGIVHSIPQTARPMSGEEAAIFQTAGALPQIAPFSDITALRGRISAAMRQEVMASGQTPTYARLSQLRGNVEDAIARAAQNQAAQEAQAVAQRALSPEAAIEARVNDWVRKHYATQDSLRASGVGAVGDPLAGTSSTAGASRAASQAGSGFGGNEGAAGLPGQALPNWDTDAAARLNAASDATRARVQTFDQGPVGDVLRKGQTASDYRLPDSSVPGRMFAPGPRGAETAQAYQAAAGAGGVDPLLDTAAESLRRETMTPEGVVNPDRFASWQNKYQDALRALPASLWSRFSNAASATQAYQDAVAARKTALDAFEKTTAGKFAGLSNPQDITKTVGGMFVARDGVRQMQSLAQAVSANPAAREGLRKAVADHILSVATGATESGASGVNNLNPAKFSTFISRNAQAIKAAGFSDAELQNMSTIAQDLQRSQRTLQATKLPGQSNTAQDIIGSINKGEAARPISLLAKIAGAAYVGSHAGPWGAMTGMGAAVGEHLAEVLRGAGITKANTLVRDAMLNPELARELLKAAPSARIGGRDWMTLRNALAKNAAVNATAANDRRYGKGGAVKSKHDRLVSRLISLADKAKAAEKSKTKNILRLPDNTVTTALAKANAAI